MSKLLTILLAISLVGCATTAATTTQIHRTRNRNTMNITWVRTQPSLPDGGHCSSASSGGVLMVGGTVLGCTVQTGADSCTIYAVEPSNVTDAFRIGIIGHEALHCFLGEFH